MPMQSWSSYSNNLRNAWALMGIRNVEVHGIHLEWCNTGMHVHLDSHFTTGSTDLHLSEPRVRNDDVLKYDYNEKPEQKFLIIYRCPS